MLTKQQIQEIKSKSLNQDKAKSAIRIPNGFKNADKFQKKEILELADISPSAVYNIAKSGAAPVRTILALSQVLNISPFYFIGAIDNPEDCTDEVLEKFFNDFELGSFPKEKSKKTKRAAKKEKEQIAPPVESETTPEDIAAADIDTISADTDIAQIESESTELLEFCFQADGSEKMKTAVDELTLDDATLLLSALFKKAQVNDNAADLSTIVKYCLLA